MKVACHDAKYVAQFRLGSPLSLPLSRVLLLITVRKVLASSAPCIEFSPLILLTIENERLVGRFGKTRWRQRSQKASHSRSIMATSVPWLESLVVQENGCTNPTMNSIHSFFRNTEMRGAHPDMRCMINISFLQRQTAFIVICSIFKLTTE